MFYLKLTDSEASTLISDCSTVIFGGPLPEGVEYTSFIEDTETGDKYWLIQNVQKDGVLFDVEGHIISEHPELTRYAVEFVKQFEPEGQP